jgi:hypothetical protein
MNPAYMVVAALSAFGPGRARVPEEDLMQYLCLIYDDEKAFEKLPPADSAKIIDEFHAYTESVKKSGHYLGGNALAPGWAIRRDEGTTRRLLPAEGARPE